MNDLQEREVAIDRLTSIMVRSVAARFPRRSFLGRVGIYTTAAAVGGTSSALLWKESALAAPLVCTSRTCGGNTYTSPCCWDGVAACTADSVQCQCLSGDAGCPSDTCECGCWIACDNSMCAFPDSVHWCDCCELAGTPPSSRCTSATNCSCHVTDCYPKEHCGSTCGTCGSRIIRCRHWTCQINPTCH